MLTKANISFHQPIMVNAADYGFNAYNQVEAWADEKGNPLGSS